VAVTVVTTGGGAGTAGGGANTSVAADWVVPGGTEFSLIVGRAALLGVAKAAIGVINIAKESRKAPNTLLLLGVVVVDRYMGTP
jgi:ABC-type Fe3+-siderophore transport system permease subunit